LYDALKALTLLGDYFGFWDGAGAETSRPSADAFREGLERAQARLQLREKEAS
jgi:hypothetical protein